MNNLEFGNFSTPDSERIPLEDVLTGQKKVLQHLVRHQGKAFSFVSDQVQLDDGVVWRDYVKHPGAVAVFALRNNPEHPNIQEVLLVSQYRHPVGAITWELPAGICDVPGEPSLETAKRELAEEADYSAKTWHVLLDLYSSSGCSSETLRMYLARDLELLPEKFVRTQEEAQMVATWVPLENILVAGLEGKLRNSTLLTGASTVLALQHLNWQGLRAAK